MSAGWLLTHRQTKERSRQGAQDWQVPGLINQGTYTWDLSWVLTRCIDLCTYLPVSSVYIEALIGFSHIDMVQVVSTTHCSMCLCSVSLRHYALCLCKQRPLWEQKNIHFKDRGAGGEPLIAWVHLMGQLAVTCSQWPPATTEQENGAFDKREVEIILNLK